MLTRISAAAQGIIIFWLLMELNPVLFGCEVNIGAVRDHARLSSTKETAAAGPVTSFFPVAHQTGAASFFRLIFHLAHRRGERRAKLLFCCTHISRAIVETWVSVPGTYFWSLAAEGPSIKTPHHARHGRFSISHACLKFLFAAHSTLQHECLHPALKTFRDKVILQRS